MPVGILLLVGELRPHGLVVFLRDLQITPNNAADLGAHEAVAGRVGRR